MALRDRLPFLGQQPQPPDADPLHQTMGTTAPEPGIDQLGNPPVHQIPLGRSGRGNFWGLPESDELNRQLIGQEGLRRFDEMYRTDPHIRRLILMAWAPIIGGTWSMEPYGGDDATDLDRQVADTIWWALSSYMSPNLIEHLATAGPVLLRSGFCPFEQVWDNVTYQGKQLTLPRKLDLRLPRSVWRWWQDDYGELTYIGQILPNRSDVVIPASELVYYRLASEGDNWQGTSLLRSAYKPWYLKDKLERIDAIGQERKAVGVPVVYPPKGADPTTKGELERILQNLHMSEVAYVMMPGPKAGSQGTNGVPQDEWLVEVVQFDSSSGDSIQASLQYHKQAIESSFAQDFMALGQHQVGARATAEVQEDPYLAAVQALAQTGPLPPLNRLVERIVQVNWGEKVQGPPQLTVSLHDSASLSEISGYVQQLVAANALEPDPELEDWLRQHADLPPANADIRAATQKARMAGLQQAANPPDPLELAKAKAQSQPAASGGEGPPANPKKPAVAGVSKRQLDATAEPTVPWFERLLSQDRLRDAFDGCRDHIQAAAQPAVLRVARNMAHQASNQMDLTRTQPPEDLVDVLAQHYSDLYALGHDTVGVELSKQRQALKALDDPTGVVIGAAAGSRLARARQRGQHSAQNIIGAIRQRLGRDQIIGLKEAGALQVGAEQAASAQLRLEALANTAAMINDGRYDGAMAAGDVVGGIYTSVLDERTCGECEKADTGDVLSPEDAVSLGPPNPMCEGKDFCRCAIVWVLSGDPAALQSVL